MNRLPSEKQAVVATIDPDAYGAGTELSDAIDMSKFESIQAILLLGTFISTGLADFKLVQAVTSGGSYKDISGKAITQLTDASPDDDKQAIINLRAEELDVANEYRFVKMSFTLTTAGADSGAIALGANAAVEPASDNDLASVAEIIN